MSRILNTHFNCIFLFRSNKPKSSVNDFTLIDPPPLTISIEQGSIKKSLTNEFEMISTSNSLSSSSISIVNSTDDFTPLASPLYSTAIDYDDKQIYDLI